MTVSAARRYAAHGANSTDSSDASRRLIHGFCTAIALGVLAGCATTTSLPPPNTSAQAQSTWRARAAELQSIQHFELHGRLLGLGVSAVRGDLNWAQDGERFDVRFFGPLGVGAVALSGRPDDLEVRTKDGTVRTGQPEAYMQQQLGWSLPLAGLRWWVLGAPAPGSRPQVELDGDGRALRLRQDGWEVSYIEYREVGQRALPRKLELADSERGFRLVIDDWGGLPLPGLPK